MIQTTPIYFERSVSLRGPLLCPICDHRMQVPPQYRARICQWCGLVWHETAPEAELSENFDHGHYGRHAIPWTRPALITECYPQKIVLVEAGRSVLHDETCEHPWEASGVAGLWAFCKPTRTLFLRVSDRHE